MKTFFKKKKKTNKQQQHKLPHDIPRWCRPLVEALLQLKPNLRIDSQEALNRLQGSPAAAGYASPMYGAPSPPAHHAPNVGGAPHFRGGRI